MTYSIELSVEDEQKVDYLNAVTALAELIYVHDPMFNYDNADYRDARKEAERVLSAYKYFDKDL